MRHVHQPTAWPVPHACAQPCHPCSGSHGQLSFYLSISLCTNVPPPSSEEGDVCTQATFPCRFYVTILPTSPSFLFPEARSHWSVPLIWSILGASRKDHNSCHKISFSFLLLWDSVTHRRLFSIPSSTHFILIPEVYKRFSISGLLLWFVLSFQVISLSHTETCYLLRFLAIFNRWTLIVKRLQPP